MYLLVVESYTNQLLMTTLPPFLLSCFRSIFYIAAEKMQLTRNFKKENGKPASESTVAFL
jgi:hypothetical protein